ncbi:DNA-binding NarL/FixJ family response regulator [Methanomicrobium sp. W14]|uniref:response regulator n=1 Tax=Methanomicrobium sp. W14 TaxID=2817839 RepID=UPI001AEB0017|nr:response regulator [Methanomicrobium sp. W14]MBP2134550.1 DNA-binding NarL/FixJ family response regulator [Methanomicrobium sp. W14]
MLESGSGILVAEDEEQAASGLKTSLLNLGYSIAGVVFSSSDAIEAAKMKLPDLLLIDVNIKGVLDGIETAYEIRKICGASVIFIAGEGGDFQFEKSLQVNPSGYLLKPLRNREIEYAVKTALSHRSFSAVEGGTDLYDHMLSADNNRAELALKYAGECTWEWDIISGRVALFCGFVPEELHTLTMLEDVLDRIYPDDLQNLEDAVDNCLKGEKDSFKAVFRAKNPGKRGFMWLHVSGGVSKENSSGKPVRALGVVRDISEYQLARIALEETNKKLNLLSSVTRHDITNQMAMIFGYWEILKNLGEIPAGSAALVFIDRIYNSCLEIKEKIDFTGVYQGLGIKKPEWQNLYKVLSSAKNSSIFTEISIKCDPELNKIEIFADPMLEKVIYNLLENSVRHGKADKINVKFIKRESGEGILYFEDNGTGVSPGMKEKIFLQGFGANTGYGLFLVKEILGITGIKIHETGNAGKGACFEVCVPEGLFRRTIPDAR